MLFFFKQKTSYDMRISDWSSDLCSSDLIAEGLFNLFGGTIGPAMEMADAITASTEGFVGWTEGIQQSGQLNSFLRGSNEILGTLVGIITKIGRASWRERVCQYV